MTPPSFASASIVLRRTVAGGFLMLVVTGVNAAAPQPNDYAQGVRIEAPSTAPLVSVEAPDSLYQAVTRADLRDVRVFNAEGAPVPHAFCAPVEAPELVIGYHDVPVYELQEAMRAHPSGDRIEVQTAAGTHIDVQGSPREGDAGGGHILDARRLELELRALQFDWTSPDNASEVRVRIETSSDLDRWELAVPATRLLRAGAPGNELRRDRVELPQRRYEYLRIQRADGGPALKLASATAESVETPAPIEPLWFMPTVLGTEQPYAVLLDTARLAPVRFARLRPQQDNSSMQVVLESRANDTETWRERWRGEVFVVMNGTERRESPPAQFEAATDRYWRVRLPAEAQSGPLPIIEFGYRPTRVLFLAQGAPYTLAYGSRRAELATPAQCDALLSNVPKEDRRSMTSDGYVGQHQTLGGETALKPLPKKTSVRVVVLWSVLVIGVGLLVAMALSLLKRVRPEQ